MPRDLTNALVASPNQASSIFGVGGANPIRQKSLFVMRFLRRVGEGGEDWKNGLSFLVKSIERPSVQPVTEEVNQYNKKRVIHTGVKYNPVSCTIYDTADGAAQAMWAQYASYYFGDYRQEPSSYTDDIINERMNDPASMGYGYGIASTTASEPQGINSQFFFDTVEVFQVWGGEYIAYRLLNPKIAAFNPDELDYEQNAASMVTMSIQYEGIYHENGGKPSLVAQNEILTELFGGQFSGETFDPVGSATRQTSFTSAPPQANQNTNDALARLLSQNNNPAPVTPDTTSLTTSSGGALSRFGTFDFGDFSSLGSNLPTELSSVAGSRDATFAALRYDMANIPDVADGLGRASNAAGNSPLDHVKYDDNAIMADQQSARYFAFDAPSDGDLVPPAPTDAVVYSPSTPERQGLSLSPLVLAAVNSRSNGTSQLGQRTTTDNPLMAFISDPTPAPKLTPDLVFGRIKLPITIRRTLFGFSVPPAVQGTIAKVLPLTINSQGRVSASGSVAIGFTITSNIVGSNAPAGAITASMASSAVLRGHSTVQGSMTKAVTVLPNVRATLKVAALVSGSVRVVSNIQGRITTLRGTINKPVVVVPAISGYTPLSGSVTASMLVGSTIFAGVENFGSINKSIPLSFNSAGSSYPNMSGSVSKALNIRSTIRARTSWGNLNGIVRINSVVASAQQPVGEMAPLVIVLSNMEGYSLTGFIDSSVVVASDTNGYQLFGTVGRSFNFTTTANGMVWPIGWIDTGVVVESDMDGAIVYVASATADLIVNSNISALFLQQSNILSGDANTGNDKLNLSGDASDGDDELHFSGDY